MPNRSTHSLTYFWPAGQQASLRVGQNSPHEPCLSKVALQGLTKYFLFMIHLSDQDRWKVIEHSPTQSNSFLIYWSFEKFDHVQKIFHAQIIFDTLSIGTRWQNLDYPMWDAVTSVVYIPHLRRLPHQECINFDTIFSISHGHSQKTHQILLPNPLFFFWTTISTTVLVPIRPPHKLLDKPQKKRYMRG